MELLHEKIILVAAAEADIRDAISEGFRSAGSHVLPVSGGIEAYELARERHIDAVLCSERLTSGTPFQLLSDIRRLHHDIPVILFGSGEKTISSTEALHRGFMAYFEDAKQISVLLDSAMRSLEFVEERKRKKVERVSVAAMASLSFGEPKFTVTAPVLNISRGWMFLSLERGFPPSQSTVEFRLSFPESEGAPPAEGKALVRWVRERAASGHLPGVGLEFLDMPAAAQLFIDKFVEKNGRKR